MALYSVEITNNGGWASSARSKDCEITIDVDGHGMTPPDTLLAALGSCIAVYVRKYAEGAKLPIAKFSVSVKAEFSKEAPISFRTIAVSLDLKGAPIDDRRKKALLDFVTNCPVHNTLAAAPAITIAIA